MNFLRPLYFYTLFSLILFPPKALLAQDNNAAIQKRVYTTTAITDEEVPEIDGIIQEEAWSKVQWSTDYIQWQPDPGAPPSEQTKMKILYDSEFIYVAFRCIDSEPDKIEKRLSRRDGFAGDWVEIAFDSYNDDRTAFSFTISAAGVKNDEFISNNDNFDQSWNPIWYAATNIDEKGWTAELKIPLSQLRFGKSPEQVWGLQSKRFYFRNQERSFWQEVIPNAPGYVSEFGELRGLKGLESQKQLEIQPYVVGQLDTYETEPDNPFRTGEDSQITVGLDAKIGITNDLTLDLTVNPDFGQVDADPAAIALDGFQVFFREQRPFFIENKNIFDYQIGRSNDNLFYSRRIGRSPQGSAAGPTTAFVDQPGNTTILGAAKFSGKTKDGWSVGVLESLTSKESARVLDTLGNESQVLVEPLTNYFVGRVQKDFNNRNSYIGGIFTSTNRQLIPRLDFLHENAYSGGLDLKHNWQNRKYYIEANLVTSHVTGSKRAITRTQRSLAHLFNRVDATHVRVDTSRTSLTGTGGNFEIGKAGSGNWNYSGGAVWRSPQLELNDIGFLRRADEINQYTNIRRLFQNPTSWYRRASLSVSQNSSYDFEGNYNRMQYDFRGNINYANNWSTSLGASHKPRIFDNSTLRGGPRWRFSDENFFFVFAETDDRKKLSLRAGYIQSRAKEDNFSLDKYELRIRYQPLDALSLELQPEYELNPNKTQYITQRDFNGQRRYIMGNIEQETLSATIRANYNINPNLTIQYYGQPFVSKGIYSDFNYVNDASAESLSERVTLYKEDQISGTPSGYEVDENKDGKTDYRFGNPDFNFVQFRTNLVVRWEYIPGSELFLVWSQGTSGLNNAENGLIEAFDNQILNQQLDNTFLIKATYRFLL